MASLADERFAKAHPKSKDLWERSLRVSRGTHHDSRHAVPYQVYTSHAQGSHKWDVDGNEYIDYTMGHGSLIFGHAHPTLVEAVSRQVAKGTHFGTEHELALEWAELVCELIPAAERVEFTSSGTEADMIATQLARAFTGRAKIAKFASHFFGWSTDTMVDNGSPSDRPLAGRLPALTDDAMSGATVVMPINDLDALERVLSKRDIAALFLEGGGAHAGAIGMPLPLVKAARELTEQYGTLLIIDEVISGFRWSAGGYQARIGVTPDLSPLGKIVSGGMPGSALCGRADVMELLKIRPGDPEWNRYRRVQHPGTWNANPVCSAAGATLLRMIASGEPQKLAEANAERLVAGMNGKVEERGVPVAVHNAASVVHLFVGQSERPIDGLCLDTKKKAITGGVDAMDKHLLLNGVHILRGSIGWVSAVHSDEDLEQTIEAFGRALDGMIDEGVISSRR